MTRNDPNIEVLAGPERRRRWSATKKVALVAETYEPGVFRRANFQRRLTPSPLDRLRDGPYMRSGAELSRAIGRLDEVRVTDHRAADYRPRAARPGHGTRPLRDRCQGASRGSDAVGAAHGNTARLRVHRGGQGRQKGSAAPPSATSMPPPVVGVGSLARLENRPCAARPSCPVPSPHCRGRDLICGQKYELRSIAISLLPGVTYRIRIVGANLAGWVDDTRSQLAVDAAVHHVTAADPCQKGTKCLLHPAI
jgi:hypothetical protein